MSNANKNPNQGNGSTILSTNQQLLIRSMRSIIGKTSIAETAWPDLTNPGLEGTDARLYTFAGDPSALMSKMIKPPTGEYFVHATPAQLSVLEPLLRFFIVDKDGNEEEVYFSEFTSEQHLDRLAAFRRHNGNIELGDTKGASVGVRRFSWQYHNKHEGDRIVEATLDLYFGSLAELVNEDYLKFIFTNGLRTPDAPPIGGGNEPNSNNLDTRLKALQKEIEAKRKFLKRDPKSGSFPKITPELAQDFIKDNFRQLKVAVGWAVPKGQRSELQRLFRSGETTSNTALGPSNRDKLENFLEGVRGTQRILLLNLRTYDVEFNQNGTVGLTIQYVASTDNYLAKNTSDVLGSKNFSNKQLQEKQIQIRKDAIDNSKVWPDGYLAEKIKTSAQDGSDFIYVNLGRLSMESDVLNAMLRHKEITNERDNNLSTDEGISRLKEWDKSALDVYDAVKKKLKYQRYSSFLERLIEQGNVYRLTAKWNSKKKEVDIIEIKDADTAERTNVKDWLKKSIEIQKKRAKKAGKKAGSSKSVDAEERNHFGHGALSTPSYARQNERDILFVRLGDILKTGMELASMREDINFILGSWYPGDSGVPGYRAGKSEYEMIYDIPISLEYFGQFFYKNVIAAEKDEWPFRLFYMALLQMVTQVLNRVTSYKLRIQFDWCTFSTYQKINPPASVIDDAYVNRVRRNINNEPYKQAKRVNTYYILYAKQISFRNRVGDRSRDEKDGIFHYTLGSSRGVAKEFNFKAQDVPQFQAANIEVENRTRALVLPQDVDIEMVGNSLHRNGDLIYVDSRAALGALANQYLSLGGYYRVVNSTHSISTAGYATTLGCVFERRTKG